MENVDTKKMENKLTPKQIRGLIIMGMGVVVLSLGIGLGVFYGSSKSETTPTASTDTTTYDSSKLYKFDDNNKPSDVTTQYVTTSSLTNNGLYKYTTTGGLGSDVQNNYLLKTGLTNNGLYKYTTTGGLGSDVQNNYLLKTGLTNNGLYKYTTTGGLGSNLQDSYIRKTEIFLVKTQESGAINAGRANGVLVNLQDNLKIIKRHYRIYDSETSTGASVGSINIPNNTTKTLYLTAPVASTTTDDFELISTAASNNWVALIEMSVTNTNGVLSGKFTKGYLGNRGDVNTTHDFATYSPKTIRENKINNATARDRAVYFNGQAKTPAGRVAVDISAATLSFLFKKLA